jgi:hypothetical protein
LLGDVRPIVICVLGIAFDVSLIGLQRLLAVVDVELALVDREGVWVDIGLYPLLTAKAQKPPYRGTYFAGFA